MKILLLTDGNGTEMQVFVNPINEATIKMYSDLHVESSTNNIQYLTLDESDLDSLIEELIDIRKKIYTYKS